MFHHWIIMLGGAETKRNQLKEDFINMEKFTKDYLCTAATPFRIKPSPTSQKRNTVQFDS
jgi:hypothetical protein